MLIFDCGYLYQNSLMKAALLKMYPKCLKIVKKNVNVKGLQMRTYGKNSHPAVYREADGEVNGTVYEVADKAVAAIKQLYSGNHPFNIDIDGKSVFAIQGFPVNNPASLPKEKVKNLKEFVDKFADDLRKPNYEKVKIPKHQVQAPKL